MTRGLLFSLSGLLLTPTPALAFSVDTEGGLCPSGASWALGSDIEMTLLTSALPAPPGMLTAMTDVGETIDRVSGVDLTMTTNPIPAVGAFSWTPDGMNSVGLGDPPRNYGGYAIRHICASSAPRGCADATRICQIVETDILFDETSSWLYGVPEDHGEDWFDAGYIRDSDNRPYFRSLYLHELLHGLGLTHTTDTWGFMNYHHRPWINGVDANKVAPLPDDRLGLQSLYPTAETAVDLVAANNYVDYSTATASIVYSDQLCRPSRGDRWTVNPFESTCGQDYGGAAGSTAVCSGDTVLTRFAVGNIGTVAEGYEVAFWFSEDTIIDGPSTDLLSPTSWRGSVLMIGDDELAEVEVEVPSDLWSLGVAEFHVLVEVVPDDPDDWARNNTLPLRGTLSLDTGCP